MDNRLLYRVNSPADLKGLRIDQLRPYCDQLRDYIVRSLADNPGHLASSLGVVELTTALHYAYHTPHDALIWDVGHQAYAHKIITARRDLFATNRKQGGLSGFPKRSESDYDAFGGGHSSVSISAALGMAKAAELRGEQRKIVAVIGDGALTGGLAFEGLNNAGAGNSDILVVLNDNHMSIDPNVGAMTQALLRMTTSPRYNALKTRAWLATSRLPWLRYAIKKTADAIKRGLLQQSNLFESLNFRYFGPVDGHDVERLARVLCDLRSIPGPKLLHVLTIKGKGYAPAERDQAVWHAPGRFDVDTGERIPAAMEGAPPRFQDLFGQTLLELMRSDERLVGITPAMPSGCSMTIPMAEFPERCFDVGIAEGHAVTFSAGLAASGMVPFCNIYSSFFQRAYDNMIHDVALQELPVVFCLDRAGLVGEDGATHQGAYDIASARCIPNVVIASPMDQLEMREMMLTASRCGRPYILRYPRGCASPIEQLPPPTQHQIGRARILREGKAIAVVSFGPVGVAAAEAIQRSGVDAMHVDLRYAKPLDQELLRRIGRDFERVITIEDGAVSGGVGSAILQFFAAEGLGARVEMLGIPDRFVEHGTIAEQHRACGYDMEGIMKKLKTDSHENESSSR